MAGVTRTVEPGFEGVSAAFERNFEEHGEGRERDARQPFGYVMNKMQQDLSGDPRALTLIEASYAALG